MFAFHDVVYLGDVYALIVTAVNLRHVFVDLHDDHIGILHDGRRHSRVHRIVEVAVAVHGRNADHHHIYIEKIFIIGGVIVKDHGNKVAQSPVAESSLVGGAVPGVIDEMLLALVALRHLDGAGDQVAPDLHIIKLVPPLRQGPVQ